MTHENKLGMFIHWGVYATYALHEQAIARFPIDEAEYEARALEFDPVDYDPEKWVLLAKEAGMKYICFTAKHHDGFCMWDTKYTDYSIMNTKYGKDVLKMLADACEKHGMLLSIYYSCPDWHHPYGYNPNSTHQWKAKNLNGEVNVDIYLEYVKNQITELLSNYGKIYTLFWDIPPKIEVPEMNELVRKLQPGIFINDRGYGKGDFSTPEREVGDREFKRFERMTEACNSIGELSWGYREEENFHSLRYLINSIDRIMALGGSYLMNVGPDKYGVITEEYASRIRAIGKWYNMVSESLEECEEDAHNYGIVANKYIVNKKGSVSYFHFYDGIVSNAVSIKCPKGMPKKATLLNTGESLEFKMDHLPRNFGYDKTLADEYLLIRNIPIDELSNEAPVIAVEW